MLVETEKDDRVNGEIEQRQGGDIQGMGDTEKKPSYSHRVQVVPASGPRDEMVSEKPLKRVSIPYMSESWTSLSAKAGEGERTAALFGALEILASAFEVGVRANEDMGDGLGLRASNELVEFSGGGGVGDGAVTGFGDGNNWVGRAHCG